MSKKNPADDYGVNEASTFQGEACETGANEPPQLTEHVLIREDGGYDNLPPTEQRPES